jgi:alpha-L-fucosidase
MNTPNWLTPLLLSLSLAAAAAQITALQLPPKAAGPFKPESTSLINHHAPEWFRDAKFGIWAHRGSHRQPECGECYARSMCETSSRNC